MSTNTMRNHEQSRVIGRRIANARMAAGLTQAQLAVRLGWPRFSLINLELGRRATTVEKIEAVAAALGVPPAVFFIDNSRLASIVARLARDPAIVSDVLFFLDAREDGPPLPETTVEDLE